MSKTNNNEINNQNQDLKETESSKKAASKQAEIDITKKIKAEIEKIVIEKNKKKSYDQAKKAEEKTKKKSDDQAKKAEEKAKKKSDDLAKKAEEKAKKKSDDLAKKAEEKAKKKSDDLAKKAEEKAKKKSDDQAKKDEEKTKKKSKTPDKKEDSKNTVDSKKEAAKDKKSTKSTEKKKSDEKKSDSGKKSSDKWSIKQLGGYLFAKMLRGGASELNANAEEVNKLNVFPVPDGDTGDNMTMTIQSGVASLDNIDTDDLAEVLRVASRGMLLGARGNSGVILSQFFAGMAKGLENVEKADAKKLAHALELGVQQAYTSVMTPTEGTILTVAREAVEYAVSRVNSKSTVQTLFSDLVNEMNASLKRTPEILPILGEAGVVDSGGAGLLYIIDGLNRVLNGEDLEEIGSTTLPKPKPATAETKAFGPDSNMDYGYCTELLVQLMNSKTTEDHPFDLETLKLYLASHGDSIVAFQTESIVKIHVHTLRPDKIMRFMLKYGDFISVKVENMSLQHTELSEDNANAQPEPEEKPHKKHAVVAVSSGEGISRLFNELGADEIVEGGQTNNPSTSDFLAAFDNINADNIFVFPNNGNIFMAASQAADIYEKAKVYVIPTKSIGAGYVALSSMNLETSEADELIEEAKEAIGRITAAYISPAVRDADMNGVHVTEGDTMGIIEKEIVISGPDKMASTYALIDIMLAEGDKFMITIFHGKDATIEERDRLAEYMLENYPLVEAYYVDGGQDIYPFLFVAE